MEWAFKWDKEDPRLSGTENPQEETDCANPLTFPH